MGRSMATQTERPAALPSVGDGDSFDVLKELTRSGYVPDTSDVETRGILLRHPNAPDLVLHADGRIEVPVGQRRKAAAAGGIAGSMRSGMSWRRTAAVVLLFGFVWFVSILLTVGFLES